jgi:hypothetical protein
MTTVEFFTNNKALLDTPDLHPRPTKVWIPDWFKNLPTHSELNKEEDGSLSEYQTDKTVRQCPSFIDYFSHGYVIPMWADLIINYNEKEDYYMYRFAGEQYKLQIHGNGQFLNWVDANFLGNKSNFVFKFISPWTIKTQPGYSVLQMPMFYHFNDKFSVLPGVVDTDIWHEVNQQVVYHGAGKEVFIPRGTPLVQYIPFKREKYEYTVAIESDEVQRSVAKNNLLLDSKFNGAYNYARRERDKNTSKECPHTSE